MAYSQYSAHRRPPPVPKVRAVELVDTTGAEDVKLRSAYQKAAQPTARPKRPFAEVLARKK